MRLNDLYVIEFSRSQGAFHVERLSDVILTNWDLFARRRLVDYVPIGLFPSRETALETCAILASKWRNES
jgi:hypothetical protein